MTTEQVTLLLGLLSTFVSGAVGIILTLIRRDMGRVQVRLAEVEAKRENARADDANMATALQLATLLATTLNPLKVAIENLTTASNQVLEKNDSYLALFSEKANQMHAVTERRDRERSEDLQHHDQQHGEIIERLDRQQVQLETITREIKVRDLPPEVRGDIARLVLLISNMGADVKSVLDDVKQIIRDTPEPGEVSKDPGPEISEQTSEEKQP